MPVVKIFTDLTLPEPLFDEFCVTVAPHQVLRSTQTSASVLVELPPDPLMEEAEVVLGQPSLAAIARASKLRWLQVTSAGITRYDTAEFRAEAQRRGVVVTNSSQVFDEACAEHALAFLLAQARQLPASLATRCANSDPAWLALRNRSRLLRGQSILLYGYGAIAKRLAAMLAPLGVRVTAVRRAPRGDEGLRVITPAEAEAALADTDHVMNILPENADSRHYFSTALFQRMKPGAVFYNIGRGATVDQDALAAALTQGPLAAAWLDVTTPEPLPDGHPLLGPPNCYHTPHIAGGYREELEFLVSHFTDNLARYLAGEPVRDRVM